MGDFAKLLQRNNQLMFHYCMLFFMKRTMLYLVALMAFVGAAFAQPKIEVIGGDTYDWGKVKPKDSPLTATIKLKNIGDQVLNIKEVKAGCGCTTTKIDKEVLKPGEIGSVDVTLNVASVTGSVTKTITAYSDDPVNGTKTIWLKAEVVRAIQLSMPYFAFNDLAIGKQSKLMIKVKNNSDQAVTFDNFEGTNGIVLNQKKKVEVKPGAEIDLEASYIPQTEGYFNGMVTFNTSNPDFPKMEVSAYGNVMKPDSPVYQK